MAVHSNNLSDIVHCAWRRASHAPSTETNKRKRNRKRSAQWVCALGRAFEERYDESDIHRVFWLGNKKNRKQFGIDEFLFDVVVCSVSSVESLQRQSKRLDFIDQCHWQVESEFNRNSTREVVVDMSKLVVGSGENKLFIAAHRHSSNDGLLKLCAQIARRCSGNVYFAFVAHPDDWDDNPTEPVLYEWLAGYWEQLGSRD